MAAPRVVARTVQGLLRRLLLVAGIGILISGLLNFGTTYAGHFMGRARLTRALGES